MKPVYAFVLLVAALAVAPAGCVPAPATAPATPTHAAVTATRQPGGTAVLPTPAPSPTAWVGRLPERTILLYSAGSQESRRLYALAADGTATDLGRAVAAPALASPRGRWVATFDTPSPAHAIVLYDLQEGRVYTVPCVSGCPELNDYVGTWAFDREESYLAFVEPWGWAPALVDLRDGSTTRFDEASWTGPEGIMPGIPLGWSASGELVLDTYRPETEGFSCGFWALALPPGVAPAPAGTLARHALVQPATLRDQADSPDSRRVVDSPRLSPDGARLLFLARDLTYKPADYTPSYYDMAMNELWAVDLASGEARRLVDVRDGGGLGFYAASSPDGREVLFLQGRYAGDVLWPATLKVREDGGTIREVAPLPEAGYLVSLDWCTPDTAVVGLSVPVEAAGETSYRTPLYTVDLASGRATRVVDARAIRVLGCVR